MPSGIKILAEKEAKIIARLLVVRHASLVAREEGVSFSKVWRLADRECIELTDGRDAKGYKRLSPERRAAVGGRAARQSASDAARDRAGDRRQPSDRDAH
jgi:hypothetical protein